MAKVHRTHVLYDRQICENLVIPRVWLIHVDVFARLRVTVALAADVVQSTGLFAVVHESDWAAN